MATAVGTALALVTATLAVAQPASAVGSLVTIVNQGSGLCLEVSPGDIPYNGGRVRQSRCEPRPPERQLWQWVPVSGHGYYLINRANNKCLDVQDGRDADRTPVQLWDCTGYKGMYWHFDLGRTTVVISEIGPRCLDVPAASLQPGVELQTYHCTPRNSAQTFILS
jgi:hypothetical protein